MKQITLRCKNRRKKKWKEKTIVKSNGKRDRKDDGERNRNKININQAKNNQSQVRKVNKRCRRKENSIEITRK